MKEHELKKIRRQRFDVTAKVDGKHLYLGKIGYTELKRLEGSKGVEIVSAVKTGGKGANSNRKGLLRSKKLD